MNFAACGVSILGQLFGIDSPITIIQMLWVNIIMDTLGALAFAGEPALDYYMREKPKRRDEPILTPKMLGKILICGSYTLLLCIAFLKMDFFSRAFMGINAHARFMTAFYALFIFFGIFNCFVARSERLWIFSNIEKNKLFIFIMLAIALIQIMMIYIGGELFRTTPLKIGEVVSVVILASTIIPFDIICRILSRLK
ncbi:MAG: cation transporting ATPase C-terminal domain-containing protein, partial [Clostridia bacterium]|nr:cation transporting ATPase C-terminal domain-containing protein [Clostridia bacterium]